MSSRPVTRWLFGKLPAHGDFVARGLDFGLRDALDHWLSGEMDDARARHGDDFAERYDAAPAWHFVDRDPSGAWSGGALCASVDRVGRRFPVMIAAPADDPADAAAVAGGCLALLYDALGQDWDADRLQGEARHEPVPGWTPVAPEWALIGDDGVGSTRAGRFPAGILAAMMEVAA